MKKVLIILLTFIFLFTEISALCSEGQIDINNADATELDKLIGIGPAYANAIINSRPFNSIGDLIDVKGIGPVTLEKIKTQGLACVEGEEQENTPEEEVTPEEESPQEEDIPEEEPTVKDNESKNNKTTIKNEILTNKLEATKDESIIKEDLSITGEEIKTIVLNPSITKDIKSEIDKEQLKENKLAIYGLTVFGILLVVLFGFKKRKDKKNEFK
jgi:competence ComEA-like helix-hairpin-helix protein